MENFERCFFVRSIDDGYLLFGIHIWDKEFGMILGGSYMKLDGKFPDQMPPRLWIMIVESIEKFLNQEVDREYGNIIAGRQFINRPSR